MNIDIDMNDVLTWEWEDRDRASVKDLHSLGPRPNQPQHGLGTRLGFTSLIETTLVNAHKLTRTLSVKGLHSTQAGAIKCPSQNISILRQPSHIKNNMQTSLC